MSNVYITTTFDDSNKQNRLNWACLMLIIVNEWNTKLINDIGVYKRVYRSIVDNIDIPYCCHICRYWFSKDQVRFIDRLWFCYICSSKVNTHLCIYCPDEPTDNCPDCEQLCKQWISDDLSDFEWCHNCQESDKNRMCIKSSTWIQSHDNSQYIPDKISINTRLSVAILCLRTLIDEKNKNMVILNHYKIACDNADMYPIHFS